MQPLPAWRRITRRRAAAVAPCIPRRNGPNRSRWPAGARSPGPAEYHVRRALNRSMQPDRTRRRQCSPGRPHRAARHHSAGRAVRHRGRAPADLADAIAGRDSSACSRRALAHASGLPRPARSGAAPLEAHGHLAETLSGDVRGIAPGHSSRRGWRAVARECGARGGGPGRSSAHVGPSSHLHGTLRPDRSPDDAWLRAARPGAAPRLPQARGSRCAGLWGR